MASDNSEIIIQFFLPSQPLVQIKKVINLDSLFQKVHDAQPDRLGQSTAQQNTLFGYIRLLINYLDRSAFRKHTEYFSVILKVKRFFCDAFKKKYRLQYSICYIQYAKNRKNYTEKSHDVAYLYKHI